jgi:hypothetical protein
MICAPGKPFADTYALAFGITGSVAVIEAPYLTTGTST